MKSRVPVSLDSGNNQIPAEQQQVQDAPKHRTVNDYCLNFEEEEWFAQERINDLHNNKPKTTPRSERDEIEQDRDHWALEEDRIQAARLAHGDSMMHRRMQQQQQLVKLEQQHQMLHQQQMLREKQQHMMQRQKQQQQHQQQVVLAKSPSNKTDESKASSKPEEQEKEDDRMFLERVRRILGRGGTTTNTSDQASTCSQSESSDKSLSTVESESENRLPSIATKSFGASTISTKHLLDYDNADVPSKGFVLRQIGDDGNEDKATAPVETTESVQPEPTMPEKPVERESDVTSLRQPDKTESQGLPVLKWDESSESSDDDESDDDDDDDNNESDEDKSDEDKSDEDEGGDDEGNKNEHLDPSSPKQAKTENVSDVVAVEEACVHQSDEPKTPKPTESKPRRANFMRETQSSARRREEKEKANAVSCSPVRFKLNSRRFTPSPARHNNKQGRSEEVVSTPLRNRTHSRGLSLGSSIEVPRAPSSMTKAAYDPIGKDSKVQPKKTLSADPSDGDDTVSDSRAPWKETNVPESSNAPNREAASNKALEPKPQGDHPEKARPLKPSSDEATTSGSVHSRFCPSPKNSHTHRIGLNRTPPRGKPNQAQCGGRKSSIKFHASPTRDKQGLESPRGATPIASPVKTERTPLDNNSTSRRAKPLGAQTGCAHHENVSHKDSVGGRRTSIPRPISRVESKSPLLVKDRPKREVDSTNLAIQPSPIKDQQEGKSKNEVAKSNLKPKSLNRSLNLAMDNDTSTNDACGNHQDHNNQSKPGSEIANANADKEPVPSPNKEKIPDTDEGMTIQSTKNEVLDTVSQPVEDESKNMKGQGKCRTMIPR